MSTLRLIVASLVMALGACRLATEQAPSKLDPLLLEPTGLQSLNEQPWDAVTTNGWQYLRRTSSKTDDIVSDPTAPFSPEHVLRIVFTPDMPRDTEPGVHWISLPRPTEVYTGWWIKLSRNWSPSPAGACKMTFLWVAPDSNGQVYTAVLGSSEPHHIGVNTEWAPYGQKVWHPNEASTPIYYDTWYRIDWYVRWATAPGAADGAIRWWVNGALNGNYVDVSFPPAGVGFQQFEFAPTIQIPPPAEQFMYIDHTYVRIH